MTELGVELDCLAGVKVGGVGRLPGGTIIVERGEVHQVLLERPAHIVIVERPHGGGEVEA